MDITLVIEAMRSLGTGFKGIAGDKYSGIDWTDKPTFTEEEFNTKITELQAEYDAQEYARNRATEYPSIADLVVALYDTDDKADIEAKRAAVKAKYPKPE